MDQATVEYISKNFVEFTAGIICGTGLGYVTNKTRSVDRPVDKSEMHKLGYATLVTLITDPIDVGLSHVLGSNTSIMKATQGDIGGILGWYIGLHMGNWISR